MPMQCCKDKFPTIPDEEPVFIIRAKDVLGIAIIHDWMDRAEELGVNPEKLTAVEKHLDAFIAFKGRYPERMKVPD